MQKHMREEFGRLSDPGQQNLADAREVVIAGKLMLQAILSAVRCRGQAGMILWRRRTDGLSRFRSRV